MRQCWRAGDCVKSVNRSRPESRVGHEDRAGRGRGRDAALEFCETPKVQAGGVLFDYGESRARCDSSGPRTSDEGEDSTGLGAGWGEGKDKGL